MDCFETKALKTSYWPEITLRPSSQVTCDDFWCGNGINDDLFVEGLLDFSNEQVVHEKEEEDEYNDEKKVPSCCSSVSSQQDNPKDEFVSVPGSELSVQADDLASLEWLSHFVEASFSEFPLQHVVGKADEQQKIQKQMQTRSTPAFGISTLNPISAISTIVPGKARSKRSRRGGRVWSLGSLPLPESYSSSSSSSSSSSTSSSSCLLFGPPAKRLKKNGPMTEAQQQQRRCSHCGVQKTPQWRTGPLGAKSLCNACGVRFKSGRLLPEYRPACSPTFSSQVHSNNHRKVLEMRNKKKGDTRTASEWTQTASI